MVLDMKKNIFFGMLLSLITFLFIFIPGVKAEDFTYTYHDRNYIFHDTGIDEYIENVNYDTINQVFYDKYGHYIEDDDYVDSFFLYYSNDNKINSNLFFFKSTEFSFEGQKTSGISIFFYYDSNYGVNQVSISLKSNVDNKADYMHFKNVDLDLSKYTYSSHGSITSDVITNFELHNLTRNLTEDVNIYYYTNANIPIRDSTHIVGYTNKDSIGPKSYEFNYQYNKKKGPLDKLYSIDYTFDSSTYNSDTVIQYELDYNDNYINYSEENLSSYLYLNDFKFYGLVNNNGLYHWEQLDTSSNSYVDDYQDYYEDGKYFFNITKFNLDFTNYEKIILRSEFFNDGNLVSAVTRSNNENISCDDVFYNTIFGPNYLNIQINTSNVFNLILSSNLVEYKSRMYTWDYSETDVYKQPYLNYFDLTTSTFTSESHGFPVEESSLYFNYDFIEKHDITIGTSSNRGIAITEEVKNRKVLLWQATYRTPFTYNLVFEFEGLFYSYNNDNTIKDKIYINQNGEYFQDSGISSSNTNIETYNSVNFDNITNFLNNLSVTSEYFNYNFELNWNKLPVDIQALIIFVFNIACIIVIMKIGGYK